MIHIYKIMSIVKEFPLALQLHSKHIVDNLSRKLHGTHEPRRGVGTMFSLKSNLDVVRRCRRGRTRHTILMYTDNESFLVLM